MDKTDKNICEKLRELRRTRGLTVDTLAKKMGENSQKVGRIERGTRSITFDYLLKVSKALDAPIEAFLEDASTEGSQQKSSTSNILNQIVIIIEEFSQKNNLSPTKKAFLVSKLYELALKFPESSRPIFLESALELINLSDLTQG